MVNTKLKKHFRFSDYRPPTQRNYSPGALINASCHPNKGKTAPPGTANLTFSLSERAMELAGIKPKEYLDLDLDLLKGEGVLYVHPVTAGVGRRLSAAASGLRASVKYVVPDDILQEFVGACTHIEADPETKRLAFVLPKDALR